MALVTINAVIHIPGHILVVEVRSVVAAVAPRALEHRVIVRARMARRANAVGVSVIDGEIRVLGMVECRSRPRRRGVTR